MAPDLPSMGVACQRELGGTAKGPFPQCRLVNESQDKFPRTNPGQGLLKIGTAVGSIVPSRRVIHSHDPDPSAISPLQEKTFVFQDRKAMATHHGIGLFFETPVFVVSQNGHSPDLSREGGKDSLEYLSLVLPMVDHIPRHGQNVRRDCSHDVRNGPESPLSLPCPHVKIGKMENRRPLQTRVEPFEGEIDPNQAGRKKAGGHGKRQKEKGQKRPSLHGTKGIGRPQSPSCGSGKHAFDKMKNPAKPPTDPEGSQGKVPEKECLGKKADTGQQIAKGEDQPNGEKQREKGEKLEGLSLRRRGELSKEKNEESIQDLIKDKGSPKNAEKSPAMVAQKTWTSTVKYFLGFSFMSLSRLSTRPRILSTWVAVAGS